MNATAKKIPYSLLSLEAVLELSTQSRDLVLNKHGEDPLLEHALAAMKNPLQEATLTVGSNRKHDLTRQINEADRKRDQGFIGFRKSIEAHQYNVWEPAKQQSSENLLAIIGKHGTQLHLEGMTVQSALLKSLFEDLKTEQARSDLAALGLIDWLAKLKTTEDEFVKLIVQRNQLETVKDILTRSEAKASLVQALYRLISGIDFLADRNPEIYGEVHALIAENAERIVTTERGR